MPMIFESEPREFMPKGEVIYRQGSPADQLVIVQKGMVALKQAHMDHRQKSHILTLDIAKSGAFIGWEAFEGLSYTATAEVKTESVISRIPVERLLTKLRNDAKLGWQLLLEIVACQRYKEEVRILDMIPDTHARKSTAGALIEFAMGDHIKGVNQQELAFYTGVCREETNKQVQALEAEGVVSWGNRKGEILDLKKLQLIRAGLL